MGNTEKYEVREITWPEKLFITKRAIVAFDDLPAFFADNYRSIYDAIQKEGIDAVGPPCAIYYVVNERKKETDVAAAVPVHESIPEFTEFEKVVIPSGKVLTTTYYGPYENMKAPYSKLEKYLKEHAQKKEFTIEEYHSDPSAQEDPAQWKTVIYFVLSDNKKA